MSAAAQDAQAPEHSGLPLVERFVVQIQAQKLREVVDIVCGQGLLSQLQIRGR